MDLLLKKYPMGLAPADAGSQEYVDRLKPGQVLACDAKKPRNPKFLAKFFSLLTFAYGYWEPGEIDCKYGVPEKSFDRFREDVIILSGRYIVVHRIDGTFRVEAKSISFAQMEEPEFNSLYNDAINVLLKRVLVGMTREQVDEYVNTVLSYA